MILLAGCSGAPTVNPTPRVNVGGLERFSTPVYAVLFDPKLVEVEDRGDVVVFWGSDREAFFAVDSFVASGDLFGNTGEDLRNRARDIIDDLAGEAIVLPASGQLGPEWDTGVEWAIGQDWTGRALYHQRGRAQRDYRVLGIVWGERRSASSVERAAIDAVRQSFEPVR